MKIRVACLAAIAALTVPVASIAAAGRLNFDYTTNGKTGFQVFDNGSSTFFHAPDGSKIQQVYAVERDGTKIPLFGSDGGPYYSVPGVYAAIELSTTKGVVAAKSAKQERLDAPSLTYKPQVPPVVASAAADVDIPQLTATAPTQRLAPSSKAAATRLQDIPFARGSMTLGPRGRSAVKQLALHAKSTGRLIEVALNYDTGEGVDQARERGRSIRAEFAKHGVSAVKFFDGGMKDFGKVTSFVVVAREPKAEPAFVAEATKPAVSDLVAQYTNIQTQMLAEPVSTGALNVMPAAVPPANGLQADAEYQSGRRMVSELYMKGLLTAEDLERATKRLQAQRDQAKAAAAAKVVSSYVAKAPETLLPSQITSPTGWGIDAGDRTIRDLLDKWAKSAGWSLVWNYYTPIDIAPQAMSLTGSLEVAVTQILESVSRPLKMTVDGDSKKLVISERG